MCEIKPHLQVLILVCNFIIPRTNIVDFSFNIRRRYQHWFLVYIFFKINLTPAFAMLHMKTYENRNPPSSYKFF